MSTIPRVLPALDDINRDFWTSGIDGQLRITRCQDCGWWIHQPAPVCQKCLSRNVKGEPVSGDGVVKTFTINRHQWTPTPTEPYIVAIVELPEQAGLRLTTNIVNCAIEDIDFEMPVHVTFEIIEDVALPLFEPVK